MIKHGLHKYITADCQHRMEMLAELLEKEYFSAGYTAGHSDGITETVQQCIVLCDQVDLVGADECIDNIKQHYGVEL